VLGEEISSRPTVRSLGGHESAAAAHMNNTSARFFLDLPLTYDRVARCRRRWPSVQLFSTGMIRTHWHAHRLDIQQESTQYIPSHYEHERPHSDKATEGRSVDGP
jgi:hypothetical protein